MFTIKLFLFVIVCLYEVNGNKNGNNVMQPFVKKMHIRNGPLEESPSEDYWKQDVHLQSTGPMRTTYELECFESRVSGQKVARINNGPTKAECKSLQLEVTDCEKISEYIRVAYFVKQLALDRNRLDIYFYQIYVVFPNLGMYYGLDVKSSKSKLNEALHCDPDVEISTKWESTDFSKDKITPMWKSIKGDGSKKGEPQTSGVQDQRVYSGEPSVVKTIFVRKNNERPLSRVPPTDVWKEVIHWNHVTEKWTHYDIYCYESYESGQKIARLSTGFPTDDNEYFLQMEVTDCDKIKDFIAIGPLEKEGQDHYAQIYVLIPGNLCRYYRHITGMKKFELDRDDEPCGHEIEFNTKWESAELQNPSGSENKPALKKLDTFKYGDKYGVSQSPVVKMYERIDGVQPLPTQPQTDQWKKLTHWAFKDKQHGYTLYDMDCYESTQSKKKFARITNGVPRDDEYKLIQMEVTDCDRIADFVQVEHIIKEEDNHFFRLFVVLPDNCMFYKLITKYSKLSQYDKSEPCGREIKVTTPWENEMDFIY